MSVHHSLSSAAEKETLQLQASSLGSLEPLELQKRGAQEWCHSTCVPEHTKCSAGQLGWGSQGKDTGGTAWSESSSHSGSKTVYLAAATRL